MLLGRGLHSVRPLATVFVVASDQVFQQLKPPEHWQHSGQGVDDARIVREKASVTLFIGVDVVSACANRGSACPLPLTSLLGTYTHSHAEPRQGIGDRLSAIIISTNTAMWCVSQCKHLPARIEFGAVYVFKRKVVRTYVYLVTFHQVNDNKVTSTWFPLTTKITKYASPISRR